MDDVQIIEIKFKCLELALKHFEFSSENAALDIAKKFWKFVSNTQEKQV
jgi:hypothetical protein